MNNRINYFFLSFVLLFFTVTPAFAATTDFTANANITVAGVTFGTGTTDMIILNNSTATSWSFSSGVFTVTNPGTAFEVGSANNSVLSIKIIQNGSTLACADNTTPGTSFVTLPTASGTYTIEPSAVTCPVTNTPVVSTPKATVSTSGGISTFPYPQKPAGGFTATIAPIKNSTGKVLLHFGFGKDITKIIIADNTGFNHATSLSIKKSLVWTLSKTGTLYIKYCNKYSMCSDPVSVSNPVNTSVTPVSSLVQQTTKSTHLKFLFTTNLNLGMQDKGVQNLQKILSLNKNIYPQGLITGYFGHLTQSAVERFQTKYKIVSSGTPETTGYGLVGPKTRAMLRSISEGSALPAVTSKKIATVYITHTLRLGMYSLEVKRLQELLNTKSATALSTSGSGSNGEETEYFGHLTQSAVERFQTKYKIVSSGTPETTGYGLVGPKTRAMLTKVFGSE